MKAVCVVEGCERPHWARGWCGMHYRRWWRLGTTDDPKPPLPNPLVCVCPRPVADPRRDFGMCQLCKRKPLELMAVTT